MRTLEGPKCSFQKFIEEVDVSALGLEDRLGAENGSSVRLHAGLSAHSPHSSFPASQDTQWPPKNGGD